MSLNKWTSSSVRQEWANIGCTDLNCDSILADEIISLNGVVFEQIKIQGDVIPQLRLSTPSLGGSSILTVRGKEAQFIFKDSDGLDAGSIVSSSFSDRFTIDAGIRDIIDIRDEMELKYFPSAPQTPPAGFSTLYAQDDTQDLATVDKDGDVRHVSTTKFYQPLPQLITASFTGFFYNLLEDNTLGIGTLQIKAREQLNHCYELKFSGTYVINSASATIRIANSSPPVDVSPALTLTQGEGSFDGTVYLVGEDFSTFNFRASGIMRFSNGIAIPLVLDLPEYVIPIAGIDITYGVWLDWVTGTVSDSITTRSVTLTRLW